MRNKKKRAAAWLMVILLVFTMIEPVIPAKATEIIAAGNCGENAGWVLYSDGLLEINGTGKMDDYPSFDSVWFHYRYEIQSVKIAEGITSIGDFAFAACDVLEKIDIPDSVTRVGQSAFNNCRNLEELVLSDNVTDIGEYAFCRAGIKNFVFPKNISSIPEGVFIESGLEHVTIYQDIEEIGERAFDSCSGLKEVDFYGTVKTIGMEAFAYDGSLVSFGHLKSVNKIGDWAFYKCKKLPGMDMFPGVEYIGAVSFSSSMDEPEWVEIPDTVKFLGSASFSYNYFTKVIVPDTIETIEANVGEEENIVWKLSNDATIQKKSIIEGDRVVCEKNDIVYIITTKSITIKNESGSSVCIDGVWVSDGKTYVSNPGEQETTEKSTEETTTKESQPEETTNAHIICGKNDRWLFDTNTGILTIKTSSLTNEDIIGIVNKVKHIVFAEGVSKISVWSGEQPVFPNLETVTISSTITDIDAQFFSHEQKITQFIVSTENEYYEAIDGNLYDKKKKELIKYAVGKRNSIVQVADGTKTIGEYAFLNARNVKEITLPESVAKITLSFESLVSIEKMTLLNPNCTIEKKTEVRDLSISSYADSQVEKRCKSLRINFIPLEITKAVKTLTITKNPDQTEFVLGRQPRYKGMMLQAEYEDGTVVNTDAGYEVSEADVNRLGTQTVQIKFGNKTVPLEISYVEMSEDDIAIVNARKRFYLNSVVPYRELYFTPVNSGTYKIYTLGVNEVYDTYGTIMDMNNHILAENDDNGSSINFKVEVQLNAGETYIIRTDLVDKKEDARVAVCIDLKELSGTCNHQFSRKIKTIKSTCTSRGYTVYQCEYCNEQIKSDYTEKEPHQYRIQRIIEPTCTEDGFIIQRCENCGYKTGAADKKHPMLGHKYIDTVVAPAMTEYGYTLHECVKCTHSYKSDWVEPIGFVKQETTTVEPTTDKEQQTTMQQVVKSKTVTLKKPKVKARRLKRKIRLTLTSSNKNVKYQIYVKRNGKYRLLKTTSKKTYKFAHKKKCYIKVRCIRRSGNMVLYSKFKKIKIKA